MREEALPGGKGWGEAWLSIFVVWVYPPRPSPSHQDVTGRGAGKRCVGGQQAGGSPKVMFTGSPKGDLPFL